MISTPRALLLANTCILSLSTLWCDFKVARVLSSRNCPTAPQQEVHGHMINRTARLLMWLAQHQNQELTWRGMLNQFEQARQPWYETLRGHALDLPQQGRQMQPFGASSY